MVDEGESHEKARSSSITPVFRRPQYGIRTGGNSRHVSWWRGTGLSARGHGLRARCDAEHGSALRAPPDHVVVGRLSGDELHRKSARHPRLRSAQQALPGELVQVVRPWPERSHVQLFQCPVRGQRHTRRWYEHVAVNVCWMEEHRYYLLISRQVNEGFPVTKDAEALHHVFIISVA